MASLENLPQEPEPWLLLSLTSSWDFKVVAERIQGNLGLSLVMMEHRPSGRRTLNPQDTVWIGHGKMTMDWFVGC